MEQMMVTNYEQSKEGYEKYRADIGAEIEREAEGFVRIGYLLKLARDTEILKESGYANYLEFASAEFGLDKSTVSRFIDINDKFSEGGNSDRLKAEYQGYGRAKLQIMLTLPDHVNEILSPEMTKAEIQTVKEEVDEEKKISDIEVAIEGEKQTEISMTNDLERVLHQLLEDDPELFVRLYTDENHATYEEIMAPAGDKIYSVRVQGVGKYLLLIKEDADEVKLTNVRSGENQTYQENDFELSLEKFLFFYIMPEERENDPEEEARSAWAYLYGRDFPAKEEVAPVQLEKKKESKVQKAPKKTEEQKYNEKQAKIDRETKKKLEEKEDEAIMNSPLPSEQLLNGDTYEVKTAPSYFDAAMAGKKMFELRKNDRNYQVGRKLLQKEFKDNEYTGREILQEITYLLEDYTGLEEGYCILGTKNLDMKQPENVEEQMSIEDMEEQE